MKTSIPRPVSVPLPAYGEETGLQILVASEKREGNPESSQASWRKMTGDCIKQSLGLPERACPKRNQELRSGISNALIAANKGSPLVRADCGGEGNGIESGGNQAGVGRCDERSGEGGSGGNDGQREDSQGGNQSHVNARKDAPLVEVSSVNAADSNADAAQVICEGASAVQAHRVRAELSIAIGKRCKLSATQPAHLQSESVAVLIEELLRVAPADVSKPLPLSHSGRPQSQSRANAGARRRIQQALVVADGIVIIATRTSQNDPEQNRQRSLLDALVDLLYMLIDLLNPVVDLMDTAARRAAWSQLKQLAFLTPYAGKLRVACDSAISLLGEET